MPFELNPTLRMIRDTLCPPWTEIVPGWEPTIPFGGYEEDDSRSQAPTRQQSMEPSSTTMPSLPVIPEESEQRRPRQTKSHKPYFQYFNNKNNQQVKKGDYQPFNKNNQQVRGGEHKREPARKNRPRAQSLSPPGRISAQNYAATEVNGAFGLIDDGQQAGAQVLIAHASKKDPMSILRLRQGDSIQALSTLHKGGFALLKVLFITRTQYFQPGRKVTSITIGVPKNDWDILQVHRPKFVRTL